MTSSPLPSYGNPNQNYVFNVTMNSTAGVNITPTIYIVDGSNNVVYSGTGTTITNNNGVAYGISTATVNITQTGNWRYFWNTSINGYGVRYPTSGYLSGPEVSNYYFKYITVPSGATRLVSSVHWSATVSSGQVGNVTVSLLFGNSTYDEFSSGVNTNILEIEDVNITLPLINTPVYYHEELRELVMNNPTAGTWTLRVAFDGVTDIQTRVWVEK